MVLIFNLLPCVSQHAGWELAFCEHSLQQKRLTHICWKDKTEKNKTKIHENKQNPIVADLHGVVFGVSVAVTHSCACKEVKCLALRCHGFLRGAHGHRLISCGFDIRDMQVALKSMGLKVWPCVVLSTVPHQLGTPVAVQDTAQERSSNNLLVVSWCGGFMVMDEGVDVFQGECSSWRTMSPSSGVYAELPPVLVEALCGAQFGLWQSWWHEFGICSFEESLASTNEQKQLEVTYEMVTQSYDLAAPRDVTWA